MQSFAERILSFNRNGRPLNEPTSGPVRHQTSCANSSCLRVPAGHTRVASGVVFLPVREMLLPILTAYTFVSIDLDAPMWVICLPIPSASTPKRYGRRLVGL